MNHLDLAPWLLVIPARFDSSRLPYKMKQDLCGKPLIIRVYENLRDFFGDKLKILVATDAQELSEICAFHKVPFFLTSSSHKSGTDRCYEVACAHDRPYILNVQGDEPFLNPRDLVEILQASSKLEEGQILTLAYRSHSEEDFHKLSVVKLSEGTGRSYFCKSSSTRKSTRFLSSSWSLCLSQKNSKKILFFSRESS